MDTDNIEKVLEHFGVKGMRWGVRRGNRNRSGAVRVSTDYSKSRKVLKKKVSSMSDKELKSVNKRLELERKLKSVNPSVTAEGKRRVGQTMNVFSGALIGGVAGGAGATLAAKILKG